MCDFTKNYYIYTSCTDPGTHFCKTSTDGSRKTACPKGPHERYIVMLRTINTSTDTQPPRRARWHLDSGIRCGNAKVSAKVLPAQHGQSASVAPQHP
ncbi:hypothetical protein ACJ41O_002391 [Fusarium nematophilum]